MDYGLIFSALLLLSRVFPPSPSFLGHQEPAARDTYRKRYRRDAPNSPLRRKRILKARAPQERGANGGFWCARSCASFVLPYLRTIPYLQPESKEGRLMGIIEQELKM